MLSRAPKFLRLGASVLIFTGLLPALAHAAAPLIGTGTGLWGDYYDDVNFNNYILSRLDPQVNFNWGTGSPDPSMGGDYFSVAWTGKIAAEYSEVYTIYLNDDDGARLYINGSLVIDQWMPPHSTAEASATITMTAGVQVPIRIEYYENTVNAVCELRWSSPSTAKAFVPQTQLYPAAASTPTPTATLTPYPSNCAQGDSFSAATLASFWTALDLGAHPASSMAESGALTITAGGITSQDLSDSLFYLYQGLSANLDAQVKVNYVPGTSTRSREGIMLRANGGPASPYVAVFVTRSNGYAFQVRSATSALVQETDAGSYTNPAVAYVRLQRNGSNYSAFYSTDNIAWTALSSTSLSALPATYMAGIAIVSGSTSGTSVGQLDDFQINAGPCVPTATATPSKSPTFSKTPTRTPSATISPTPSASPEASVSVHLDVFDARGVLVASQDLSPAFQSMTSFQVSSPSFNPSQGPLVLSSGTWSSSYNGMDNSGHGLAPGLYLLQLSSSGKAGSALADAKVAVTASGSGLLWAACAPNPLNPGSEGVLAWGPASAAEIKVFDASGALVRVFYPPAGTQSLHWDLKDAHGNRISSGIYLVALRAMGQRGQKVLKWAIAR
jgi:hypothetical protein